MDVSYISTTVSENELVLNSLECLQKVMKIIKATAQQVTSLSSDNKLLFVESYHSNKLKFQTFDLFLQKTGKEVVGEKNFEDEGAIFANSKLYLIGGRLRGAFNSITVLYCRKNLATKDWERKASMLQKRSRLKCALMGNSIYVAGGQAHKTEILNSVEYYDIDLNIWTTK